MMNAKSSSSKWPWHIELQECWHGFTDVSSVQEVETDISDSRAPSNLCLLWAKRLLEIVHLFLTACEGKQYANKLVLNVRCGQALLRLEFNILQTPSSLQRPMPPTIQTLGKWHFLLNVFVGPRPPPPNHPADHEMSSFHHSEMQMTGATIISHSVIISYAFREGKKCVVSVIFSVLSHGLKGRWLPTQTHEKVRRRKHILYSVLPHWLYKDFHFCYQRLLCNCSTTLVTLISSFLSRSIWWAPLSSVVLSA